MRHDFFISLFKPTSRYLLVSAEGNIFFLGEVSRLKNQKWGAVANLEEYRSLFKDAPQDAIVGEMRNITRRMLEVLPKKLSASLYEKITKASVYKPSLSVTDRAKLIEIYRPEILRLQDLIDRDLSRWLTV